MVNMETKNIMIVGVGGQGSLLASKLLGHIFLQKGYDVKVSEVHGMSQRGGSVVTYVRYGKKVYSPIIDEKEADFILSFELLETMRAVSYLKKDGRIITNTQSIDPMPVIIGAKEYPINILENLNKITKNVDAIDCLLLAEKSGSKKAVNIVLLGKMSKYFDFDVKDWMTAIEEIVPQKFVELNKKAFLLGREAS